MSWRIEAGGKVLGYVTAWTREDAERKGRKAYNCPVVAFLF